MILDFIFDVFCMVMELFFDFGLDWLIEADRRDRFAYRAVKGGTL